MTAEGFLSVASAMLMHIFSIQLLDNDRLSLVRLVTDQSDSVV